MSKIMRSFIRSILVGLFALWGHLAQADLTVTATQSGNVNSFVLSIDELKALPQSKIDTSNSFVSGTNSFTGPSFATILDALDISMVDEGVFTAANDYQVTISISELIKYDAVLAMSMNGEMLSIRDKGPLWVIYPMDDHEELQDPRFNDRLIWQLVRIDLR